MRREIGPEESIGVAVAFAVSAAERRPPESLPPLADTLDPDALNALFGGRTGDPERGAVRVSFPLSDSLVTVEGGARITVEPLDDAGE